MLAKLFTNPLDSPLVTVLRTLALILIAISLLFYIGYCFDFMLDTFHYLPQADDYRLTVYHIKPFLEDRWTPAMLWGDVHPNPLHGLILIGSTYFENMSFRSLPYLLFPFLLIKWLLINKSLKIATFEPTNSTLIRLAFLLFGFIVFSFNGSQQYLWNSVAIANIYHAMGALFIFLIARNLQPSSKTNIIALLLFTTAFLICCRQFAAPWVYATIITSLMLVGISKRSRLIGCKLIAVIFSAMLFEVLFYKMMGIDLHYDSVFTDLFISIQENWGGRIDELFKFSITELAMPILYPWFILEFRSIDRSTLEFGVYIIGGLFAYTFAIAAYRLKDSLSYFLPIVIFAFVGITIVATVVYRTDEHTNWLISHIPRYIVFRNIAVMAIIWILIISVDTHKLIKWLNYSLLVALTSTLAWSFSIHLDQEKIYKSNRLQAQNNLRQELSFIYSALSNENDIRQDVIIDRYYQKYNKKLALPLGDPDKPHHRWKIETIQFWGDNNLSTFKDSIENEN